LFCLGEVSSIQNAAAEKHGNLYIGNSKLAMNNEVYFPLTQTAVFSLFPVLTFPGRLDQIEVSTH